MSKLEEVTLFQMKILVPMKSSTVLRLRRFSVIVCNYYQKWYEDVRGICQILRRTVSLYITDIFKNTYIMNGLKTLFVRVSFLIVIVRPLSVCL